MGLFYDDDVDTACPADESPAKLRYAQVLDEMKQLDRTIRDERLAWDRAWNDAHPQRQTGG